MATTDSTPGTPTATPSSLPAHRYVPGAPPPVPPSKSQKKKRQSKLKTLAASAHESALTDHAPDSEDIKAGKVDSALLAGAGSGADTDAEDTKSASAATPTEYEKEKSLVVDAISKRIKALGKKVQRLNEYKAQDNINDDQKAAISGLAALEGSVKELESIKKTVEGLEISQAKIRSQERSELKRDYEHRVTEAAQHAEAALLPRITSLLSFLALRSLLTHSTPSDISISEPERNAIISAGDILLAHPPLGHVEEVVKGFLAGAGSWEDVEYSRLLEITSQFAAPRPPTPIPDPSIPLDPTTATSVPDEPEPEAEPEVEQVHAPAEPETEPEIIANDLGIPAPTTTGGGFHFMQESELEAPPEMTESQEWVAVQPGVNSEDVAVGTEESQADFEAPNEEAGAEVAEGVTGGGAPLDWATAGDDELPDLGGLQATFGGSGSQTPVAQSYSAAQTSAPSGPPAADDDGFTPIPGRRGHGTRASFGGERGSRGRGRGRGGYRGGEAGGYRGDREGGGGGYRGDREGGGGYRGDREGGYRNREGGEGGEGGGEGGGYRSRGGYRGGYRGEGGEGGGDAGEGRGRGGYRGGYRGDGGEGGEGGRGGYRGGGEGGRGRGFGGGWRGDGERGGRGGYRGSGERRGSGFRGGRGGPPGGASPAAETTAS